MKSPRVLQVYKMPPKEDVIRQLVRDNVIGKMEPSPHLYGDKPEVHVIPVNIPFDILYH